MQETEFNFKCDWNGAFEDPEFIKTFSTEILENYILKTLVCGKIEYAQIH